MIPLFKVFMSEEAKRGVDKTLSSGYLTQGPRVEEFEYELKRWLDVRNVLALNSCTSAIQLALYLAGVRYGDYVISTPMTCTATNTAILAMGGRIIWADINPLTGNICPKSVKNILDSNRLNRLKGKHYCAIKAIIAVDWAGQPADIEELRELSGCFGSVPVIEDAAHAFGAVRHGYKTGNHADFTCFSFQAIKHLTTADGGALVCRNSVDHSRAKLLRWYGIDRDSPRKDFRCEEDVAEAGWKYHMNDLNASMGLGNLQHMNTVVGLHQANGEFYDKHLRDAAGISLLDRPSDRRSAHWIYTLLVSDRETFQRKMFDRGITTSQVHARNDTHTMFSDYRTPLRGVDEFSEHQISIPVGWWLTEDERLHILESTRESAKL